MLLLLGLVFFKSILLIKIKAYDIELEKILDIDKLLQSISLAEPKPPLLRHSVLNSKKGDLHMLINDFKEREIKLVAKCDGIVEFLSTDELKLVLKR